MRERNLTQPDYTIQSAIRASNPSAFSSRFEEVWCVVTNPGVYVTASYYARGAVRSLILYRTGLLWTVHSIDADRNLFLSMGCDNFVG